MWIVDDLFDSTYIRDSIQIVEHFGSAIQNPSTPHAKHLKELGGWAVRKRTEGYHTIYTHAFISVWAAFEACVEDALAAMIRTDRKAAEVASALFPKNKYDLEKWPWPEVTCSEIAKKFDQKAKKINKRNEDVEDLAARCQTIFGWFDVPLEIDDSTVLAFNEAGAMRNVILHQYGLLRTLDCERFPSLGMNAGDVIKMDLKRLGRYQKAVAEVFGALLISIGKTRFGKTTSV